MIFVIGFVKHYLWGKKTKIKKKKKENNNLQLKLNLKALKKLTFYTNLLVHCELGRLLLLL